MDKHTGLAGLRDQEAESLAQGAEAADARSRDRTAAAAASEAGGRIQFGGTVITVRDPRIRQSGASPATRRFLERTRSSDAADAEPMPDEDQTTEVAQANT